MSVSNVFRGVWMLAYAHRKFANLYNMYNKLLPVDASRGPSRKLETWAGDVLFFYFCTTPFLLHECITTFKLKTHTQKPTNKQTKAQPPGKLLFEGVKGLFQAMQWPPTRAPWRTWLLNCLSHPHNWRKNSDLGPDQFWESLCTLTSWFYSL